MAVQSRRLTVGTEPTIVSAPGADRRSGTSIMVQAGTKILYVGGPDVDATQGYPVAPGSDLSVDLDDGEALYGVVTTGTDVVAIMRSGL